MDIIKYIFVCLDEEKYSEKVELSMLHKQPSKLQVFDEADTDEVLGIERLPYPNEKFIDKPNIPRYGSYYK